ncbi:MAG TPA: L-fucokinase [Phycisphaerae bacterium]|nr:L-fucokinase [Phycisphaerae bacterium]
MTDTTSRSKPVEGIPMTWDYLIITAANESQAASYHRQVELRRNLGLLPDVREVMVVPDPHGRRIGSGGATLRCLLEVLNRHRDASAADRHSAWTADDLLSVLNKLRILIVHAGGDSRRLPPYSVCGKLFIPVPGHGDSCLPPTLFDRQMPAYLALPPLPGKAGQIIITSGDVLVRFDPTEAVLADSGFTGLGCLAPPEQAAGHGVFCCDENNRLCRFLQKPTPTEQATAGAIDPYGQSLLDIGVTHMDAATAVKLLQAFELQPGPDGEARLTGRLADAIDEHGLDFYREICCALGSNPGNYVELVQKAGSTWDTSLLRDLYERIHELPFQVCPLPRCSFLHFGTTGQIISSGYTLLQEDQGRMTVNAVLDVNNEIADSGQIVGRYSWVEGCRIQNRLTLGGENIVVGIDVDRPLTLPAGCCLDVLPGWKHDNKPAFLVRCYHVRDEFKATVTGGMTFCGRRVQEWLDLVGATVADIWDDTVPDNERTFWTARLFPVETEASGFLRWLWMFDPTQASEEQKFRWRSAPRFSLAQAAESGDPEPFLRRRFQIRGTLLRESLRRMFRRDSDFSASDLATILRQSPEPEKWVAQAFREAHWHEDSEKRPAHSLDSLTFARILHTLGTAIEQWLGDDAESDAAKSFEELERSFTPECRRWLAAHDLQPTPGANLETWSNRLRAKAFQAFGRTIIESVEEPPPPPRLALRTDEIVWGRAPVRLDWAGGWTDTPPYTLEHGGSVVNTAVNLNGLPPIQVYGRRIDQPVIRLSSIDQGVHVEISSLAELLDYRRPDSEFALAKASLAISGFSPEAAAWKPNTTLRAMLEAFGGGIELTTLAAVPKGSGLGTSSIVGAVILSVIQRILGRSLQGRELFHNVLRLEQALTTGGGWQDQIGGAVGGTKIISTQPGLIPDPTIHYLPSDLIDPNANGGVTLIYYTGITRLAKNILEQVVGRYLNRDRRALASLRGIHDLAPAMANAISRKDLAEFGRLTDFSWKLNKELDPNSTNPEIESVMARIQPFIHGAKLVGAGGGGFMCIVCRSPRDAERLRTELEADPPNPRARFFDFNINTEGLVVTVC